MNPYRSLKGALKNPVRAPKFQDIVDIPPLNQTKADAGEVQLLGPQQLPRVPFKNGSLKGLLRDLQ